MRIRGIEVVILNEEELIQDVLSIITVFSAKLYGSRSHKNKRIVETTEALFRGDENGEEKEEY